MKIRNKMKFIEVHNIKEYNENIEKCIGFERYHNKNAYCLFWKLRTIEEFNDPEIRKIFKSNVSICDEAIRLLGKIVIYSGHDIGVLRGVEITEEDFYWIIEDPDTLKEISMSCVGRLDKLDIELCREAINYGNFQRVNNTPSDIAFINGAIWRENNPTPEMIERILDLAWNYREDEEMTNLEYILKNYKK
jgi:hypothetical protein